MVSSDLPAILGGPPACSLAPPAWPIRDDDVLAALQTAFADGSWGRYAGGSVEHLETELARAFAVGHALTCGSGTFAVELALRALHVGPGDEVIMAGYDFAGNFLNIHALGAKPVLVDLHRDNWNLDPARLEAALGPATKAILASHLHGGVVPMSEVMEIARRRRIPVIEDFAQMPGAIIQGRPAGTWGDLGVVSFGGSKLLTAGRGGALVTNRKDLWQRARTLQFRGNIVCPLSELQAAALIPQLAKLSERNERRTRNVELLPNDIPGLRPFQNAATATTPGYYKVGFQFDADAFGLSREQFLRAAQAENIAIEAGFQALHVGRSPNRFRAPEPLTQASRAHAGAVVLHHPILLETPDRIDDIARGFRKLWTQRAALALGDVGGSRQLAGHVP